MSRYLILSDIHANLMALDAVLSDVKDRELNPSGLILLGDIINYGMRPNEVIQRLTEIDIPIVASIRGNHEQAIIDNDLSHFSTQRGKDALKYMRSLLTPESMHYIKTNVFPDGMLEIADGNYRLLLVHGTIEDPFWGKFGPMAINDNYGEYDYVLMGHSHIPMLLEHFFDIDNPETRNKSRTIFINPGSVGQPRNHNPRAQYVLLDTDTQEILFCSTPYDIIYEQSLYDNSIDSFYKIRIAKGL